VPISLEGGRHDDPTELPPLTADIVEDDELLAEWVDDAIRLDPVAEARRVEIAEWRGYLRDACEPDLWKLVVEIESRVTQRWADLGCVLLRYGFARGRPGNQGRCTVRAPKGRGKLSDAPMAVASTGEMVINATHSTGWRRHQGGREARALG